MRYSNCCPFRILQPGAVLLCLASKEGKKTLERLGPYGTIKKGRRMIGCGVSQKGALVGPGGKRNIGGGKPAK